MCQNMQNQKFYFIKWSQNFHFRNRFGNKRNFSLSVGRTVHCVLKTKQCSVFLYLTFINVYFILLTLILCKALSCSSFDINSLIRSLFYKQTCSCETALALSSSRGQQQQHQHQLIPGPRDNADLVLTTGNWEAISKNGNFFGGVSFKHQKVC